MGSQPDSKRFPRQTPSRRRESAEILDWQEIYIPFGDEEAHEAKLHELGRPLRRTAVRYSNGCPLTTTSFPNGTIGLQKIAGGNALPATCRTNNFPEFTGRICPAPCEEACVLGINEKPVTIQLVDKACIEPPDTSRDGSNPNPATRAGKSRRRQLRPAGLAAAAQLSKAGTTSLSSKPCRPHRRPADVRHPGTNRKKSSSAASA